MVADGGLDLGTAAQVSEAMDALVAAGLRKIILDCSQLQVISSAGLGAMLSLHGRVQRHNGDIKIAGLSSPMMQVIRTMKLDRVFGCYSTVDEARLVFRTQRPRMDASSQPPPPGI